MRIPRIYVSQTLASEQQLLLDKDAANHLVNVLRLKAGHPIVLFNGDGNEYPAQLLSVSKKATEVLVDAKLSISVESPLHIHLGQAISKGDRMDFVLQKSVELGVSEITPVMSSRSTVKLDPARWEKKWQQWQKIIIGACEQCGRNTLPKLHAVCSYQEWLAQSTAEHRLLLDPTAEQRFTQLPHASKGFRLLIGPEGGLSEAEIYQAVESGYHGVQMGARVLRTETAALAAISVLQGQFGDF